MGMLLSAKCDGCWERIENCTCCERTYEISRCSDCGRFLNKCVCKSDPFVKGGIKIDTAYKGRGVLGKIKPVKAYQTSDGRKFVGKNALEDAQDHQRWLDGQDTPPKQAPRKKPLKKLKRKRKKIEWK